MEFGANFKPDELERVSNVFFSVRKSRPDLDLVKLFIRRVIFEKTSWNGFGKRRGAIIFNVSIKFTFEGIRMKAMNDNH